MNVGKLTTGIVMALISVFVGYTLFNSLFTTVNTAAAALNTTLIGGGYTSEGALVLTSWKFYILAVPLALLAGAVWFIIKSFNET